MRLRVGIRLQVYDCPVISKGVFKVPELGMGL